MRKLFFISLALFSLAGCDIEHGHDHDDNHGHDAPKHDETPNHHDSLK